jgi:hypothetical protein
MVFLTPTYNRYHRVPRKLAKKTLNELLPFLQMIRDWLNLTDTGNVSRPLSAKASVTAFGKLAVSVRDRVSQHPKSHPSRIVFGSFDPAF